MENLLPNLPPRPESLVLRPNNPRSESIVKFSIKNNDLRVYSDYDEKLIQILKSLDFKWSNPFWMRTITTYDGNSLTERLIESAYTLLDANFVVSVPDVSLKDRIENADFADEQTRWIFARTPQAEKYAGWFAISWKRYHEDFYAKAKRITGARWSKPSMVVPPEHFEELVDFAEINGFEFSDAAKELLAKAKTARESEIRVELKPRKQKTKAKDDEPSGEIDESLRDD